MESVMFISNEIDSVNFSSFDLHCFAHFERLLILQRPGLNSMILVTLSNY